MSEQDGNSREAGMKRLFAQLLEAATAALDYRKLDADDRRYLKRAIEAISAHQGPLVGSLQFLRAKHLLPSLDHHILNLLIAACDIGRCGNVTASAKTFVVEEDHRALGKKSREAARKKAAETWEPHAKEIAAAVRMEQPASSQDTVADEIGVRWKYESPKGPSHRTLVRFISRLEQSGELPPRTGSRLTLTGS